MHALRVNSFSSLNVFNSLDWVQQANKQTLRMRIYPFHTDVFVQIIGWRRVARAGRMLNVWYDMVESLNNKSNIHCILWPGCLVGWLVGWLVALFCCSVVALLLYMAMSVWMNDWINEYTHSIKTLRKTCSKWSKLWLFVILMM